MAVNLVMVAFFALTFAISWGGIIVILAVHGFDLSPLQPVEGGLIFLMMLLGPSFSGLTCIALTRTRADSALRTWGLGLRARIGFKRAAVAVARKLAVIMHAMLKSGQSFQREAHPMA